MKQSCKFPDCGRPFFTKKSGLCQSHYLMQKKGLGLTPIRRLRGPEEKALELRQYGFEPLVPYPGQDNPWLCRCSRGHETWVVFDRLAVNKESCIKCRHPSLAETHPQLREIWDSEANHPETFDDVSKGSDAQYFWRCRHGHSFKSAPSTMTRSPRPGCGVCSGHQVLAGLNDLASQDFGLLSSWDQRKNDVEPESIYVASQKKYWFLCKNQHSIFKSPYQFGRELQLGRVGCKYCANLECLPGWNDLQTVAPQLATEYLEAHNPLPAGEISAFGRVRVVWKCLDPAHPPFLASTQSRVRRGTGCGICSRSFTKEGVNDVLTTFPWLEDRWSEHNDNDLSMLRSLPKSESKTKFLWKCLEENHSYRASVDSVVRGKRCLVCVGQQVIAGFNDLESSVVGQEFDYAKTEEFKTELGWASTDSLAPSEIFVGSKKKAFWLCKMNPNHRWPSLINLRTRKDKPTGCPYCAGTLVDQGVNDIATRFPEIVNEWSSKNVSLPSEVAFGSHTQYLWRCPKGHRDYEASPHNRCRENGTGCPDCNTGGFETSKPAYIYFIRHIELAAYKIGIANSDSKPNRLNVWKALGWEEIQCWESKDGRSIYRAEQDVLRKLIRKELNLPQALSKTQMEIGSGQNETFPLIPHIENAVKDAISRHLAKSD